MNAPLGIQNIKTEFLRRGSPRMRSVMSTKQNLQGEAVKSSRHSSKKARVNTTKDEGLMGSKNPIKTSLMRTISWNCRRIENDFTVQRLTEMCQKYRP